MVEAISKREVARYVLNYLNDQKLDEVHREFCRASKYLQEEWDALQVGIKYKSIGLKLEIILADYVNAEAVVDRFIDDEGLSMTEKLLAEKIEYLVRKRRRTIPLCSTIRRKRRRSNEAGNNESWLVSYSNKRAKPDDSIILLRPIQNDNTETEDSETNDQVAFDLNRTQPEQVRHNQQTVDKSVDDDVDEDEVETNKQILSIDEHTPVDFSVISDVMLSNPDYSQKLANTIAKFTNSENSDQTVKATMEEVEQTMIEDLLEDVLINYELDVIEPKPVPINNDIQTPTPSPTSPIQSTSGVLSEKPQRKLRERKEKIDYSARAMGKEGFPLTKIHSTKKKGKAKKGATTVKTYSDTQLVTEPKAMVLSQQILPPPTEPLTTVPNQSIPISLPNIVQPNLNTPVFLTNYHQFPALSQQPVYYTGPTITYSLADTIDLTSSQPSSVVQSQQLQQELPELIIVPPATQPLIVSTIETPITSQPIMTTTVAKCMSTPSRKSHIRNLSFATPAGKEDSRLSEMNQTVIERHPPSSCPPAVQRESDKSDIEATPSNQNVKVLSKDVTVEKVVPKPTSTNNQGEVTKEVVAKPALDPNLEAKLEWERLRRIPKNNFDNEIRITISESQAPLVRSEKKRRKGKTPAKKLASTVGKQKEDEPEHFREENSTSDSKFYVKVSCENVNTNGLRTKETCPLEQG